ncbi:hypothetical protein DYBT9275_05853 [Dyadobacter sp. CECT 9275]|uniref:Uncharacterized protein n=1 Tax=Dyadobacter helix TaxID=2822344 RepID=A0A916JI77_9BACT|nr:hypothetical protein [Dyadobacter sp. CECT 9275]CAG5017821.1 hypothetical protein DYBT9275_05853 [Dyadobacter sp. CECT 9275]
MCIYYINREDLTYESAEHILMAGIGGMKTLPKEYVSTQFNNDISKIEQEFLRESLISLPRQFLGPGKRGSLNPKYQSRSKVHLLRDSTDSEFSLGYMQKGTPYLIPQFKLNLNNGEIKIIINNNKPDKSNAILDNFHRNLQNPETLQIKRIIDNRLPENIIFFGIQDGIEEHFD